MRILIHEWSCSGGLPGGDDGAATRERAAVPREGRAMFLAALHDAARADGLEVTATVDARLSLPLPAGVRPVPVPPGRELEHLTEQAVRADVTLVVAPETSGILRQRVAFVRAAGGRVLAAEDGFIAIASDKQATANALAAAGVPVPAGRALGAGEPWPAGFHLPAVRKDRDGVGCDGLLVVSDEEPPAADSPTRLEAFVPGVAIGVSCLCGADGPLPLPPVLQRFTWGMAPAYRGGSLPIPPGLAARASALARRAIAAVSRAAGLAAMSPAAGIAATPAAGWVGVDMILGDRDDGRHDRVLEVNPRLTTSFVGLASVHRSSLVRALIDVADRRTPTLVEHDRPGGGHVHFDAEGTVWLGAGDRPRPD